MKHRLMPSARFFFVTAPLPCPYLPGRFERRLVTELSGRQTEGFHDALSRAGFRRSHGIAYVPVCRDCNACAAVRVLAHAFAPSRSQRRVWARNEDLVVKELPARATQEQYALFRAYQQARHGGGEMARMDFCDYQTLVEDTPVDTLINEVRSPTGRLVGACLTDRMADGFSAVYSFFETGCERRSFGHVHDPVADRAGARRWDCLTSISASGSPSATRWPTSRGSDRSRPTRPTAGGCSTPTIRRARASSARGRERAVTDLPEIALIGAPGRYRRCDKALRLGATAYV